MIPELGHFALILALLTAVVLAVAPFAGAARGDPRWMALAPNAAAGLFVFQLAAFGCLAWAFARNDFSVLYVAANSNATCPCTTGWPRCGAPTRGRCSSGRSS